jgi:thiol-disulfide isomerase/thioredoxin/pimeloyl-ACP methyl ester carboxylesterase
MKTRILPVLVVVCLLTIGTHSLSTSAQQKSNDAAQVSATPMVSGETLRLHSARLGEERKVQVYLPPSYGLSAKRYPVIYTLDGAGTAPIAASAVQFMTGYASIPQMPEALVIGVINTNRNRDMPIPQSYGNGGEANFLAFLTDELIPLIDQRYRTQPLRILLGHSQGGLFATYALSARPSAFQWYLAMDAPLAGFPEIKPLIEQAKAQITKNSNYHGRFVSIENLYGWKKEWAAFVEKAPKAFYGAQVELKDETHESMAFKGIYEGLKRLFLDYAPNLIRDNKSVFTLAQFDAKYKAMSEAYGYQIDIPEQLLLTAATHDVAMQYGAEALELIKRAASLYGDSPFKRQILADAETVATKGRDPRFEQWAKLGPPALIQMKPFLGSWVERKDQGFVGVISFTVKAGEIHTQYAGNPPGGEPFQLEVAFVQVLGPQTVQWGLRNGRGPGVMVYTAKLVDTDTLGGSTEGVGFIHAPPPQNFVFKRQAGDAKISELRALPSSNLTRVSYTAPQSPGPRDKVKEVAIGSPAPDWQLKTVKGDTVALSTQVHKVVVLDFWANWCVPCRKLEPLFDQLVRQYQDKPVSFFTLSIWPDRDFNAQAYLREHKMASTFLLGTDAVASDYGIWGVPTYYVIDAEGKVSDIHVLLSVDPEALAKHLHQAIDQALSKTRIAQSFAGSGGCTR